MAGISIIIPAYNTPSVGNCIRSVLAQDIPDLEIIVVDDGSTDSTPAVLDELAAQHPEIRVFHTANRGVSAARNTALQYATAPFISFVDADDILYDGALSLLTGLIEQTGAEIAIGRLHRGTQLGDADTATPRHPVVMDAIDAIRGTMLQRNGLDTSPCAKVFRRHLFENPTPVRFREGSRFEDIDIFYRIYERAHKIAYCQNAVYHYHMHPGSFMHDSTDPQRYHVLDVTQRMLEYMTRHHPSLVDAATDRLFSAAFNTYYLALRNNDNTIRRQCLDLIRKHRFNSLTAHGVRPKNRIGALVAYMPEAVIRLLKPLNSK